jgi:Relaxase/Mobilisation nuclease domain
LISKLIKGGSFSAAGKYIAKENSLVICSGNLFCDSPEKQAAEMRAVSESATTKKPVFHVSLSLLPGQKATDDQWKVAAETYLHKMGFDLEKTQYQVTRHTDSENDHVHILANRVMLDGQVLSDRKDFIRSHEATREAEKAANLPAFEKDAKANTGKFFDLQEKITAALSVAKGDVDKFAAELKKSDIEFKLNRNESGRATGALFTSENRTIPGSQIARQFSIGGLQKAGLQIPQPNQIKLNDGAAKPVSHLPTSSAKMEGWSKGNDRSSDNFVNKVERQGDEDARARNFKKDYGR